MDKLRRSVFRSAGVGAGELGTVIHRQGRQSISHATDRNLSGSWSPVNRQLAIRHNGQVSVTTVSCLLHRPAVNRLFVHRIAVYGLYMRAAATLATSQSVRAIL